jgi:molecular chaperone GrpE
MSESTDPQFEDAQPEDDRPIPSAAELAARRAQEIAEELAAEADAQPADLSVDDAPPSEEMTEEQKEEQKEKDDPFARYRDLPAPTDDELLELRRKADQADTFLQLAQRAKADFSNYQKRMDRERKQIREFARRDIILEMLGFVDKFQMSLKKSAEYQEFQSLLDAMRLVGSDIDAFMSRVGLTRMETAGKLFDSALHDAAMHVPGTEHEPGTVIDEIRSGYTLGDLVLRPAQVVVAKGPDAPKLVPKPEPEPADDRAELEADAAESSEPNAD